MNNNLYTYIFKYIMVGDSNVGKSCILLNYIYGIPLDRKHLNQLLDHIIEGLLGYY